MRRQTLVPVIAALAAVAAVVLVLPAAAAAKTYKAKEIPFSVRYLAESGDAASSFRIWRASDGLVTSSGSYTIGGLRSDGTAVGFKTYKLCQSQDSNIPGDPPIESCANSDSFGMYATITSGGAVTPFNVSPHAAPTPQYPATTRYFYYDDSGAKATLPAVYDTSGPANGGLADIPWVPTTVTPGGKILWLSSYGGVFDTYATASAAGATPTLSIYNADNEHVAETVGMDDTGRIAYQMWNEKTPPRGNTAFTLVEQGILGGLQISDGCVLDLSSDGYLLVTTPLCGEGEPSSLRVYGPDGALAWTVPWPAGTQRSLAQSYRPHILTGGLVSLQGLLFEAGKQVDLAPLGAAVKGTITSVDLRNAKKQLVVHATVDGKGGVYLLSASIDFNGTVSDPTGAPVAGATITITGGAGRHLLDAAAPIVVKTGKDGRFSIELEPGTYTIAVSGACFGGTSGKRCVRTTTLTFGDEDPKPLAVRADNVAHPVAAAAKGRAALRVAKRTRLASLGVRCARVTGACAGTATIVGGLGSARFSIAAGKKGAVALKLTKAAVASLAAGARNANVRLSIGKKVVTIPVRLRV